MQDQQLPIVIIGTGLAGYNLAREIRKLDTQTPLLLISADDGSFYSKPMLSNALAKNLAVPQLVTATAEQMADELNLNVRSYSQVEKIDGQQKCVYIGQEAIYYRDLVLAQGAQSILPEFTGRDLLTLHTVNDLTSYAEFRQQLQGKQRVLVLGAGLIGCELANDLLLGGFAVDLVAHCAFPVPTLLPQIVAEQLALQLENLGAKLHLPASLVSVQAHNNAWLATLDNAQTIEFDLLLCAVGLQPRMLLAQAAGIKCEQGIVVDRYLQTNLEHIYALGDCAQVAGYNLQYIMPLMACARALAGTLTGSRTAVKYGPMPITLKTPACPIILAHQGVNAEWVIEGTQNHLKLTHWHNDQLQGYILLGDSQRERMKLNRALPALFD